MVFINENDLSDSAVAKSCGVKKVSIHDILKKCHNAMGIVFRESLIFKKFYNSKWTEWTTVKSCRSCCVIDICDSDDLGIFVDLITAKPKGIS